MITGIFIEECKHRFLAKVYVNGKEEECYMPTSSKLSKIIELTNHQVYLTENIGNNLRTKYKVHCVRKDNNLILLDLNYINNLFFSEILLGDSNYLQERTVNNLKVDFLNEVQKEIIEIKGLISEKEDIIFPHSNANRVIRQLNQVANLSYHIRFIFILMNPKINRIILDNENTEFMENFKLAIKKKVKFEIYKICWEGKKERLKKVEYNLEKNIFKTKSA